MVSFRAGNTAYLLRVAGRCMAGICINSDTEVPEDRCSRWALCLAMFKATPFKIKVVRVVCLSVEIKHQSIDLALSYNPRT